MALNTINHQLSSYTRIRRKATIHSTVRKTTFPSMTFYAYLQSLTTNKRIGKGRVGITLTSQTPTRICACPKPGPGFPTSYFALFFYVLLIEARGDSLFAQLYIGGRVDEFSVESGVKHHSSLSQFSKTRIMQIINATNTFFIQYMINLVKSYTQIKRTHKCHLQKHKLSI